MILIINNDTLLNNFGSFIDNIINYKYLLCAHLAYNTIKQKQYANTYTNQSLIIIL